MSTTSTWSPPSSSLVNGDQCLRPAAPLARVPLHSKSHELQSDTAPACLAVARSSDLHDIHGRSIRNRVGPRADLLLSILATTKVDATGKKAKAPASANAGVTNLGPKLGEWRFELYGPQYRRRCALHSELCHSSFILNCPNVIRRGTSLS